MYDRSLCAGVGAEQTKRHSMSKTENLDHFIFENKVNKSN